VRAGADSSSSTGAASPPPRADVQRLSSLLSQPKGSAGGSFDGLGMVARSSKKIHADGSTTDAPVPIPEPVAPSTPVAAAGSGGTSDKKKKKGTPSSAASAGGSPGALVAAPEDPPKTVYE
jgi:hypothetical protein